MLPIALHDITLFKHYHTLVLQHNRVNQPPSSPQSPPLPPRMPEETSSCPSTPPPRLHKDTSPNLPRRPPPPRPPNPPARRPSTPPPYQAPSRSQDNEVKLRPSMIRNAGDPGVKDLINLFDSQVRVDYSQRMLGNTFTRRWGE